MITDWLKKNWVRQLLILTLGALSSFAMQPYEFWPVLIIGLSGYWLLITVNHKPWQSFMSGYLFGMGYFVAGLWWVGNALLVDGNPYIWALPLAVFGLPALLSFFPLMGAGISQFFARGRSLPAYLFFVATISFWEWGRGHMFTGFPWNLFGMTWTSHLPFAQLASIGGVHFLNMLTIFLMTLPAFLWKGEISRHSKFLIAAFALLVVIANTTFGLFHMGTPRGDNKDVVIQIVTPNIAQKDKWNPDKLADNFWKTVRMMHPDTKRYRHLEGKTRVIALPETALLPEVFSSPDALNALRVAINTYPEKTYLLSGALRREEAETGETRYYNSLIAMDKTGQIIDQFDKFHLVPFGEYIPFQKYVPFGPVAKFAGFQGGKGPATWWFDGLPPVSPLICYEIIFAGQVTDTKSVRPEWIVNVTNDAWYGFSPGPHQHLAQAQFRAIEEGIPVIRSTNTGISAVISPYGDVVSESPLYEDYVQETYLPYSTATPTLYARSKDLVFFVMLILFAIPTLIRRVKR